MKNIFTKLVVLFLLLLASNISYAIELKDFPDLKKGAWQTSTDHRAGKLRLCTSDASSKAIFKSIEKQYSHGGKDCLSEYAKEKDSYLIHSKCKTFIGIGTISATSNISGDFEKKFTVKAEIKKEGQKKIGITDSEKYDKQIWEFKGGCKPNESTNVVYQVY